MPGGSNAAHGLQAAPPKPRIQLPSIQAIFGLSRNDSLEQLSPGHPSSRPTSPSPSTASSQHSRASADLQSFSLTRHRSDGEFEYAASSRQVPRPAAPPRSSSLRSARSGDDLDGWRRPRTPESFRAALDDYESSDGHSSMEQGSSRGAVSSGGGAPPFGYSVPPAANSSHRASSYASSVRSADTSLSRFSHTSTAASSLHSLVNVKSRDDGRPPYAQPPHPTSSQADLDRARHDLRLSGPASVEYRSRSVPHAPPHWPQPPPLPPSHPTQAMMAPPTYRNASSPGRRSDVPPSPVNPIGGPWTNAVPPSAYTHPQAATFYTPPLPSPGVSPVSPSDPSASGQGDSDLPRYACTQCPKRFSRPSSLRIHQYSHSGERPFVCEECGRGFSVASNLKRHYRVHQPKSSVPPSPATPASSAATIFEEGDDDEDEGAMDTS